MKMTPEQKAVHYETWEHIHEVQKLLRLVKIELDLRALIHDQSKLRSCNEMAVFAEYTPKLKHITYGSNEYRQTMKEMGFAIEHHQKNNRHHPEYFKDGINGMNLIDLIEMICDWKAATLRTKDGDIYKSLNIQKERFQISDQLLQILTNTVKLFEPKQKVI